ncbi:hypothetical protein [Actinophytocola xinjiangensis]|nr:hypothetical protein [Actinophytocola xinjiangensis]
MRWQVWLTGPMDTRSGLGARKVSQAAARSIADAAADTFLRAYASE